MAMTQEQFDGLVKRLESFARQKPESYKLRVGLLAVLGYAYIFLVLAGLIGLLALLVMIMLVNRRFNINMIKLVVLLLVPAFIILRSLWVTFPPPIGLPLNRKEAPRLFALVDELTSKLQTPGFHHILLTNEFNAGVVQIPRLGLFGWHQNYLIIGLPLMQALSQSQFRAVLAHELGHLSGNHSRFAGWIYRVRKTHTQIWERLHQGGVQGSSIIFEWFFKWYFPFFNAYSFVLARMDEYEADRCAAELAGAKNAAEALINVEVKARFLESDFWPNVYKQVTHKIEPPAAVYANMSSALVSSLPAENVTKWFDQALKQKTNNADTHPCLSDRLAALGYLPNKQQKLSVPPPVKLSAADQLLGILSNRLIDYFSNNWKQEISTGWRQKYAYVQESLKQLQSLEEKAEKQSLTEEEAWNRACWTLELKGDEVAIPLFREILKEQPDHAAANYNLGQMLLQKNDESGIDYIEKAMKKDPGSVVQGCDLIYYFLMQQEKVEEAKVYQKRADEHYNLLMLAKQERSTVTASDEFQFHDLESHDIENLSRQLSVYSAQLEEVYFVKKVVKYYPEDPFYVMAVVRRRGFFEMDRDKPDNELADRLSNEVRFPGHAYIIVLNENGNSLKNKLRKIKGSIIYK